MTTHGILVRIFLSQNGATGAKAERAAKDIMSIVQTTRKPLRMRAGNVRLTVLPPS